MKRLWVLGTVLVVFALGLSLLVGCGGGTTTTTAGDGTATTAAPGGTGDTIPLGVLTSFTGEMGAFGSGWNEGVRFAVDDINAAGGVLGKKIVVYTEDDRTNIEEATKGARKLISVNKVVAITGMTSDVWVAVYPIAKDAKVMAVSSAGGTIKMDGVPGDFKFRTCASDTFDGKVVAKVLTEKSITEAVLIYENGEQYQSIGKEMKKSFEAAGGKILAEIAIAPRQSTYAAELAKAAEVNPKAVWLGCGQETGATLLKDAAQRAYKWQWMVSADLAVPEMFGLVGNDIMEGILTETGSADTGTEQYKAWFTRFEAKLAGTPVTPWSENHYDAATIIALAMVKGGAATGEAVNANYRDVASPPGEQVYNFADGVAALKAGKDINYEGVSGPCDQDEFGNTAGSYISEIGKSGKWETLKFYPASEFLSAQ